MIETTNPLQTQQIDENITQQLEQIVAEATGVGHGPKRGIWRFSLGHDRGSRLRPRARIKEIVSATGALEIGPSGSPIALDHSEHPTCNEVRKIANDENYTISERTIRNACRVYEMMPTDLRRLTEAYPTDEGDVYVEAQNERGDHVTMIVQANGRIIHSYKIDNFEEFSDINRVDRNSVTKSFEALREWGKIR